MTTKSKSTKSKKVERGDKIRNRAKVIKEIIKDPTQSQREIAKKTGLGKTTVKEHLDDLPNTTKDDQVGSYVVDVIKNDVAIVKLGQKILLNRMKLAEDDPKYLATRDIISATDLSGKRHMLLQGNVTDEQGGLIKQDFSLLTDAQLDELLNK